MTKQNTGLDFLISNVPKAISLMEMTGILTGKKQGKTQREIKEHIDSNRKYAGTFTGQGISTNTISRLLSPKTGKKYKRKIEQAWFKHEAHKEYKSRLTPYYDRITDPQAKKDWIRDKKRLYAVYRAEAKAIRAQYVAEDDQVYLESA